MLKDRRGFTLIEIVLVLAIAGLLLVIVFFAVSGAQKSRRDAERKTNLARISALIISSAGNNAGKYPTGAEVNDPASAFRTQYGTLNMLDPVSGQHYVFQQDFNPCDASAPYDDHGPGYISYDLTPGGPAPYKLRMCLEQGEYELDGQ